MRVVRLIFLAATCAVIGNTASFAGGVSVPMDNVTLVSFKRPVATVYMGNASIADLTIIDSRHVFVLGKRFGTTNLIALSVDNKLIANEPVTVVSRGAGAVTIFRGAGTYNYNCTRQHCETRPEPGDVNGQPYVDNTEKAAEAHEDTATKSATASLGTMH
jgi:hypothetical protein